jgi:hypothetical protein
MRATRLFNVILLDLIIFFSATCFETQLYPNGLSNPSLLPVTAASWTWKLLKMTILWHCQHGDSTASMIRWSTMWRTSRRKTGTANWNTWRKFATVSFCPPQIPHDNAQEWTQATSYGMASTFCTVSCRSGNCKHLTALAVSSPHYYATHKI